MRDRPAEPHASAHAPAAVGRQSSRGEATVSENNVPAECVCNCAKRPCRAASVRASVHLDTAEVATKARFHTFADRRVQRRAGSDVGVRETRVAAERILKRGDTSTPGLGLDEALRTRCQRVLGDAVCFVLERIGNRSTGELRLNHSGT